MIKNIDSRFNYANMYNWTNDLPENTISQFHFVIDVLNRRKEPKRILEIGTFTGTSAIKLVELVNQAEITVIDLWEDYNEIGGEETVEKIKENNIEMIFYENIKKSCLSDLFTVRKGDSFNILLDLIKKNEQFDLIYVDGSHMLLDSYMDICLSFEILSVGGFLIIDDVPFNYEIILSSPLESVKRFLEKNKSRIKVLFQGYRLFLQKIN